MNYYIDIYLHFSCLAGECPSTCCSGWSILVDNDSRQRFLELEDTALREDIVSHIYEKNGSYYFEHHQDGSCYMLDEDGLCRIQRNLDEPSLCITCRKFPRLAARVGNDVWMSMAASCPVVANYLWKEKVGWLMAGEKGKGSCQISLDSFPPVKQGMEVLNELPRHFFNYDQCLDLVEICSSLLIEYREYTYYPGSFDYFEREELTEEQIRKDGNTFAVRYSDRLQNFRSNYLLYRLFSRYLEEEEEMEEKRYCQIVGELALMYTISFSCFCTCSGWTGEEMPKIIQWVYRFCVHGEKLSVRIHEAFCRIFKTTIPIPVECRK